MFGGSIYNSCCIFVYIFIMNGFEINMIFCEYIDRFEFYFVIYKGIFVYKFVYKFEKV